MKAIVFTVVLSGLLSCGQQSADAQFERGERATHDVESYDEAVELLTQFIESFPTDRRADVALQALARVYQAQGEGQKAIAAYESLIERFPQSRYVDQAQFMIGYIHDLAGRKDAAVEAYQKVIDVHQNSDLVDDAAISIQNIHRPLDLWILPDSLAG